MQNARKLKQTNKQTKKKTYHDEHIHTQFTQTNVPTPEFPIWPKLTCNPS